MTAMQQPSSSPNEPPEQLVNHYKQMIEGEESLDLSDSNNNIGDEGAAALARALEKNSSLASLDLRDNIIGDDGAAALARALEDNSSLSKLSLHDNIIGDDGADALARALEKNSSLQTLDLSGNNIGHEGAAALARALEKNSSLTKLSLSDSNNNIGDEGAAALARALEKNSSLQTLDLSGNNIGHEGAAALARALEKNSSLTELSLRYDNIGYEGAAALARALEKNSSLMTLHLDGNNIGDEGAATLARALGKNSSLAELYLGLNNIRYEGADALARALEKNSSLQTLYLFGNIIGDEGAAALARALEKNSSLMTLDLGFNDIGDEGAAALARALEKNSSLTSLHLRDNIIGDEGAAALARALGKNSSLAELYLGFNNIGYEGAAALARALEKNSSLTSLYISGNKVGREGEEKMVKSIELNPSLKELDGLNLSDYWEMFQLPPDMETESNETILSFLRQRAQDTAVTVVRVKVLIVGPGLAGKTTLVHRLATDSFQEGQFEMTDGVVMRDVEDEEIRYSFWDFGGQEMYLNSHSIFMSDETVLVLVWNPRSDRSVSQLSGYFNGVRSRASRDVPVLLVSTRASSCVADGKFLSKLKQQLRCDEETPYYAIDSKDGTGYEDLKRGLAGLCRNLSFASASVPRSYSQLERRLVGMRSDCFSISDEAFAEECSRLGITDDDLALRLLDRWGVVKVLSGGDIVLEPQQLSNVFAEIISCRNPSSEAAGLLRSGGVIEHDDLGALWPANKYSARLLPQFLSLFHECELAYELFDDEGRSRSQSLVPALLPDDDHYSDFSEEELFKKFCSELHDCGASYGTVTLSFDHLPANLFPKLQVRLRSCAVLGESWRQCCVWQSSSGEEVSVVIAVLHEASRRVCLLPAGSSLEMLSVVFRTLRMLMEEDFPFVSCSKLTWEWRTSMLSGEGIVKRLKKDLGAAFEEDGQSVPLRCFGAWFSAELEDVLQAEERSVVVHDFDEYSACEEVLRVALRDLQAKLLSCQQLDGTSQALSAVDPVTELSIALRCVIPVLLKHVGGFSEQHVHVLWVVQNDVLCAVSPHPMFNARENSWVLVRESAMDLHSGGASRRLLEKHAALNQLLQLCLEELGVLLDQGDDCSFGLLTKELLEELHHHHHYHHNHPSSSSREDLLVEMRQKELDLFELHTMNAICRKDYCWRGFTRTQQSPGHLQRFDRALFHAAMYQHHTVPLLPDITRVSNFVVLEEYLVRFRCPVCGSLAASGEGYRLRRWKGWLRSAARMFSWGLLVAQLASVVTPVVGQTGVADVIGRVRRVLGEGGIPEAVMSQAQQHSDQIVAELEQLEEQSSLVDSVRGEIKEKHMPRYTPHDIQQLRALLVAVKDKPERPEHTGLELAVCDEDASSSWVCASTVQGELSECAAKYRQEGEQCLLVRVQLS